MMSATPSTPVFPLATTTWDEAEYAALERVVRSGMFTMGREVQAFEREFAAYCGSRYAVMVNSGSSANLLMVASLFYLKQQPLQAGDEVIVPAVSWSTTYFPLHQYGLKLKFVDIDLHTLNYDLDQLEAAVSPRTRLIMAVNLLGNPNDFHRLQAIAARAGARLIEDNCESMGAEFDGKKAGTFGVMGSFSCFFSHHISTMEGGVVVTDDEELAHILLCLRAHGWTRNLPAFNQVCGQKSADPFKESFRFVLPGYNLRPLEMSGAIGLEQLKKLPAMVRVRRENALDIREALGDHPHLQLQLELGKSSWFGFSLVIRPESDWRREDLIPRLRALGFELRPIVAGNFANCEAMKYLHAQVHGVLRNAEHIDQQGLFIGNHHYPMQEAMKALRHL
jgi:CDP-6-deoxy-D-xylo-4-hexulose-3-dehydrase